MSGFADTYWKPIETAPKNPAGKFYGPVVLVFYTADMLPWPAYWGPGGPDNAGCWHVPDGSPPEMDNDCVTHWMPLPEPPALEQARKERK